MHTFVYELGILMGGERIGLVGWLVGGWVVSHLDQGHDFSWGGEPYPAIHGDCSFEILGLELAAEEQ